jgi:hypothetical protein
LQDSPDIYLSVELAYLTREPWLMFLIATTIFGSMLDMAMAYKINQRCKLCQPYHFIYALAGLAHVTRTIRLIYYAKVSSEGYVIDIACHSGDR